MRNIETTEMTQVAGGDTEDVDSNLGSGIAYVIHGMCSEEAALGGIVSPLGAVVGAIVHYANKH